jgi:actin-related protein 6
VTEVNGDTQYLIGSVSKVFSDLMLLKSGIDLQAPVTDFLPQLSSPRSRIRWEGITLEMLADHLAGIAPAGRVTSILKLGYVLTIFSFL